MQDLPISSSEKEVREEDDSSEEEQEQEEDDSSDSETERREMNLDSVKKKPLDDLASSVKSTAKRPGTSELSRKDVKRGKKEVKSKTRISAEDTKKTYFQRLWSERDEISLLQGVIDFIADRDISPFHDINGLYEVVQKLISFPVSKNQFTDKIRSLKKKYVKNLGKGKNDANHSFAKPHDQKAFNLSKTIWGLDGMGLQSGMKARGKSKKSEKGQIDSPKQELVSSLSGKKDYFDAGDITAMNRNVQFETMLLKAMSGFGMDELKMKQGWAIVGSEDKKRTQEKWNNLRSAEMNFLMQKSELIHETFKIIAETLRSSH